MATLHLHRHRDPFRPPEAPGLGRGMLFALAAHIALVVAISINVQWRTKVLPTAEAELWSAVPHAAAPKEELPPPEPEPKPEPPKAKPDPTPPQPTAEEIRQQRDAEIAVAKAREEKKRKEEEKRLSELEEQKKKALKDKADKLEKEKQDKLDRQKADEKAKADKLKADKAEQEKQDKLDKLKEAKAQKEADAKREAQRQENLKRMMGMAGASGGETAKGTQQKSSGPSSSWAGRVIAQVRRNITYADNGAANPSAEVEVRLAPDGAIIGRKLVKSSGIPEFDNAVLRALDKTETLPRDTDGSVPSSGVIIFRPKDLQ